MHRCLQRSQHHIKGKQKLHAGSSEPHRLIQGWAICHHLAARGFRFKLVQATIYLWWLFYSQVYANKWGKKLYAFRMEKLSRMTNFAATLFFENTLGGSGLKVLKSEQNWKWKIKMFMSCSLRHIFFFFTHLICCPDAKLNLHLYYKMAASDEPENNANVCI